MLYTGITRSASDILVNQNKNMVSDEKKQEIMQKMVKLTYDLKKELEDNNLNSFGEILHENRLLKKEMS
jgi:D-glycero-alpha-D-manno-heptose-7-phosphate kinase